jgi:hypothetical protein
MPEASGFGNNTRIGFDIALSARMLSSSAFDEESDSESIASIKYTMPSAWGRKWRKERRAAYKGIVQERTVAGLKQNIPAS